MNLGRRRELIGKHGENWDTWSRQRHVDGAGCFIEKAQSTRPTRIQMCFREGDDERKLFERLEKARAKNGKARHDERW